MDLGYSFDRWCDFVHVTTTERQTEAVEEDQASAREQLSALNDQLMQHKAALSESQTRIADHRLAWKVAATLRWSGQHGHMANIDSPRRLEMSLLAAKAFSCWRDRVYTVIRLRELNEAQLEGLTWGIARLQGELAATKENLQQVREEAATFHEERELATAALAMSLRIGGVEEILGTPRSSMGTPPARPTVHQQFAPAMRGAELLWPEEGIPPSPYRRPPPPPLHAVVQARSGGSPHARPRAKVRSVRAASASPQTPSPRYMKPATLQEFEEARRTLTRTVSGSPTPLSATSSTISPRSIFQSHTGSGSSPQQRASRSARLPSTGAAAARPAESAPLRLAPVTRSLEPVLGLAVEFETALATAYDMLDGEQAALQSQREARFEELLAEQQRKEAAFQAQFSAGLQFDSAPPAPGYFAQQPAVMAPEPEKELPYPPPSALSLSPEQRAEQEADVTRFIGLLTQQQQELDAIKEVLSPLASPPMAVSVIAEPAQPARAPSLEDIEAQQKEAQVKRFEALLAAQRLELEAGGSGERGEPASSRDADEAEGCDRE